MATTPRGPLFILAVLFVATLSARGEQPPQKMNSFDLGKAQRMLDTAYADVKKNYYDPKYHGIDVDARYREINARLQTSPSLNDGMRLVAVFLDGFKDSHLFFDPPIRPYSIEWGFRMGMVGDQCLVFAVRPGTDAAAQLHPGDRITSFNGFQVNRGDIWTVDYYFKELSPQAGFNLEVQSPDGKVQQLMVKAVVKRKAQTIDLTNPGADYWDLVRREEHEEDASDSTLKTFGDVTYWKMPEFSLDLDDVDDAFSRVRKHGTLVLDLRGNPGGYTNTLGWMLGHVFDHDVKIADRVGRKGSKPMIAKKQGATFSGKIIVLIDARSASAAELFAKVIQLEHRGTVIGDKSSGSVMESKTYQEVSAGGETVTLFAFSVTDADLIMTDGKSLEKVGVTPDELLLPTPQDLAASLDPVLSRAATLAGGSISPEQAGKMFPSVWLPFK